jgi:hypothetical protein
MSGPGDGVPGYPASSEAIEPVTPFLSVAAVAMAAAPWLRAVLAALVAVYAAGVLWAGARHIAAHVRLRLLARTALRLPAGEAPYPAYRVDAEAPPCALGFPRRCIFIPASLADRIAPEELEMILRHETAHIDRRDPEMTLLLGLLGGALFWPNPTVHALVERWRLAAEMSADAAVAAGRPAAQRMAYARLLVAALRNGRAAIAAPAAALRLNRTGDVKVRLAAILDLQASRANAASRLLAGCAGAALAAAGALGCAVIAQAAPTPFLDRAAITAPETALSEPAVPEAGLERAEGAGRRTAYWDLLAGLSREELAPVCESGEVVRARAVSISCLAVRAPGTDDLQGAPVAFMSSSGFLYYGDLSAGDLTAARSRLQSQRDAIALQLNEFRIGEGRRRAVLEQLLHALEGELASWEVAGWVAGRDAKQERT